MMVVVEKFQQTVVVMDVPMVTFVIRDMTCANLTALNAAPENVVMQKAHLIVTCANVRTLRYVVCLCQDVVMAVAVHPTSTVCRDTAYKKTRAGK